MNHKLKLYYLISMLNEVLNLDNMIPFNGHDERPGPAWPGGTPLSPSWKPAVPCCSTATPRAVPRRCWQRTQHQQTQPQQTWNETLTIFNNYKEKTWNIWCFIWWNIWIFCECLIDQESKDANNSNGILAYRLVLKPSAWRLLGCQDVWKFVEANGETLDAAIDYNRDLGYDYFGFLDLIKDQVVFGQIG